MGAIVGRSSMTSSRRRLYLQRPMNELELDSFSIDDELLDELSRPNDDEDDDLVAQIILNETNYIK